MILFILPNFSGGGAERVSINLLNHLYKNKHSVELIIFNNSGPLSTMVDERIHVHDLQSPNLHKAIFPLISKLYSLRPQVVFSTLSYVNLVLICIKFLDYRLDSFF